MLCDFRTVLTELVFRVQFMIINEVISEIDQSKYSEHLYSFQLTGSSIVVVDMDLTVIHFSR